MPESVALEQAHCRELVRAGRFPEAMSVAKALFLAAQTAQADEVAADALDMLAWCCLRLGDGAAGIDCTTASHRLWTRLGQTARAAGARTLESMLLLDM